MLTFFASAKKAVVAAVGVALTALTFAHSLTFLPAQWTVAVGVVLAILTPVATWLAPNKPAA